MVTPFRNALGCRDYERCHDGYNGGAMRRLLVWCERVGYFLVSFVVVVVPWLFGAWTVGVMLLLAFGASDGTALAGGLVVMLVWLAALYCWGYITITVSRHGEED